MRSLIIKDQYGKKTVDSNEFTITTILNIVASFPGAYNLTVALPEFDPARGFLVVTFYNGNLPSYIPLPEYRIEGSYPNARVRLIRKYSGQVDQPMHIWAAHTK